MVRRTTIRKPGRLIALLIVLALFGYGGIKFGQSMYHVWRLTSMLHQEQRSLDDALERIDALERDIDRLTNDLAYIEKIAREEYGMIKDGEEVFRISNQDKKGKN